jgi:CheY-like chemotaxis protein
MQPDIHLPEMTGVALCEKMRALGLKPRVILITGHVDEQTLEMSKDASAAAVLFKPFSRNQLLVGHDQENIGLPFFCHDISILSFSLAPEDSRSASSNTKSNCRQSALSLFSDGIESVRRQCP